MISFDGRIILAAQILSWNFLSKGLLNFLKFKYWGKANFEKKSHFVLKSLGHNKVGDFFKFCGLPRISKL